MPNSSKIEMLFRLCITNVHSSPCLSHKEQGSLAKEMPHGQSHRRVLVHSQARLESFPLNCSQPLSFCLPGGVNTTKPLPWLQALSSLVESGCSATWSSMLSSAFLCWGHSSALPKDLVLFSYMMCQLLTQSWLLPCRRLQQSCCCLLKLWMKHETWALGILTQAAGEGVLLPWSRLWFTTVWPCNLPGKLLVCLYLWEDHLKASLGAFVIERCCKDSILRTCHTVSQEDGDF